jgi:3-hydroxyacyl-[acyl-carrier-protein] dehydratase
MGQTESLTAIRERLKAIIRRDLKLGDIEIADDMVFFNESSDLDSLDMLLLVTSVEREFGFKIPSQEVGREVFHSVDTLSRYIQTRAGKSAQAGKTPADSATVDPLAKLPHRDPFRFVSQVTSLQKGESGEGLWRVSGSEAFFSGHFPGRPIVPGVLLGEALAQLSGLVAVTSPGPGHQGHLAHMDVRFEQSVTPPAEIVLRSRLQKQMGQLHQFEVSAMVGGAVVARGTVALHLSKEAGSL